MSFRSSLIGDVVVAGLGQDGAEIADADKAGRQMAVLGRDVVRQMLGGQRAQGVRQQAEAQGQDVGGLRVALDLAVGSDIGGIERRL